MKVGDAVKVMTDAIGIPQCDACARRQRALNDFGDNIAKLLSWNKGDGDAVQTGGTKAIDVGEAPENRSEVGRRGREE